MRPGVHIENGLTDWQILQQVQGAGEFTISGRWYPNKINNPSADQGVNAREPVFQVCVRVVNEDSGIVVIPWIDAEMTEGSYWKALVSGVPVGGLYRIETCLDNDRNEIREWSFRGDMVHHVGVGDLYVITGQSNAAGYGKNPVYDPAVLGVHILKNSGKWDMASNPLSESTGMLHINRMDDANTGVSPYLSFARRIYQTTGVPVGLIQAAKGGSALAEWDIKADGHLYRAMLESVRSCTDKVRGILWYQGCSDVSPGDRDTYLSRFSGFTEQIRFDLGDTDLPILTCQLNRHITRETTAEWDKGWAIVRDAQRLAARTIPEVYVIPTLDATLSDAIHNSSASNIMIGERLAAVALKYIYNKEIYCDAPDISNISINSSKEIVLEFSNVPERIFDYDTPVDKLLFKVEDESGDLGITNYRINGNKIIFEIDRLPGNDLRVHHVPVKDFYGTPFKDSVTHLPILAFYNVKE